MISQRAKTCQIFHLLSRVCVLWNATTSINKSPLYRGSGHCPCILRPPRRQRRCEHNTILRSGSFMWAVRCWQFWRPEDIMFGSLFDSCPRPRRIIGSRTCFFLSKCKSLKFNRNNTLVGEQPVFISALSIFADYDAVLLSYGDDCCPFPLPRRQGKRTFWSYAHVNMYRRNSFITLLQHDKWQPNNNQPAEIRLWVEEESRIEIFSFVARENTREETLGHCSLWTSK